MKTNKAKRKVKGNKILISVVMPAYNRGHCIKESMMSVLLQDTGVFDLELIISDDGSTDNTAQVVKSVKDSRIKFLSAKVNGGVNVARNLAIGVARGEYILFLDSDDFLVSNAFDILVNYFPNPHKIILFSTQEVKKKKRMTTVAYEGEFTYKQWLESREIGGEFLSIVHKSVFVKDLFDEERFCFESFFWNRIVKKYGVFASPIVLREYSFDSGNRVSSKLSDPAYASRRFADYVKYLDLFGKDFVAVGLIKKLAGLYVRTAVFALLAHDSKNCREYLKKSYIYSVSAMGLAIYCVSFLPNMLVGFLFKVARKFVA